MKIFLLFLLLPNCGDILATTLEQSHEERKQFLEQLIMSKDNMANKWRRREGSHFRFPPITIGKPEFKLPASPFNLSVYSESYRAPDEV